ncbi:MAG: hypothetical protein WC157_01270 [Candidatus Paceibacterota bacterium]
MHIPKKKLKENYRIPKEASLLESDESIESSPYLISFSMYKNKFCGLENLEKGLSKNILKFLKVIGNCTDLNHCKKRTTLLKFTRIDRKNEYLKLYNSLDPEDIIYEYKPSKGKTCRVFFCTTIKNYQKIFNLVSITSNKHFETKKF